MRVFVVACLKSTESLSRGEVATSVLFVTNEDDPRDCTRLAGFPGSDNTASGTELAVKASMSGSLVEKTESGEPWSVTNSGAQGHKKSAAYRDRRCWAKPRRCCFPEFCP